MSVVLVIDDNASMREMVRDLMTREKHEVVEAADGEIGLRVFKARTPALVITDIFMPNMEGIETIRAIRRLAPKTVIVAMTGSAAEHGDRYLGAASELGADATIKKPFRPDALRDIVRALLVE